MTKILFVCVENAGRSQMAEAFFRKYAPKKYQTLSAGTKPASKINSDVNLVMKELGIDLAFQKPKTLTSEMLPDSITINMGCMDKESCPALFTNNVDDWQIPDPKGKSLDDIREIRDVIESKVKELIRHLENNG